MSDETGTTAFTVTFKAGKSYEDPWIVVRGDSTEELLVQLDALGQSGVVAKTVETAAEFQGVYAAASGLNATPVAVEVAPTAVTGGTYAQAPFPTTPAPLALVPQAPAVAQNGLLCQHGAMVPRSGTKNGRNWSGWFCPTPQGTPDQCSPQFNR